MYLFPVHLQQRQIIKIVSKFLALSSLFLAFNMYICNIYVLLDAKETSRVEKVRVGWGKNLKMLIEWTRLFGTQE